MRHTLVFLLLVSTGYAVAQSPQPADVKGWDKATWGMKRAELKRVYPQIRNRQEKDFAWTDEDLLLDTFLVGKHYFNAVFHVDSATDSLGGVILDCLDGPISIASFDTLAEFLESIYGAPSVKKEDAPIGGITSREWNWVFRTTAISVGYLDMGKTRGAIPGIVITCFPTGPGDLYQLSRYSQSTSSNK